MSRSREKQRKIRHDRVRKNVYGTPVRPRLSVYKSLNHIHAQLIDDTDGETLVAASSNQSDVVENPDETTKTEQAEAVGRKLAERALDEGIDKAVFDRGGFSYQGRIRAFAEGARDEGLDF